MSIEYVYPSQNWRHDAALAPAPAAQENTLLSGLFGEDGLSFKDVLDAVNPLQQLPIVGPLYRAATGDSISSLSRIAGGFLLGGPVGVMVAAAESLYQAATGEDVATTALAMLTGHGTDAA